MADHHYPHAPMAPGVGPFGDTPMGDPVDDPHQHQNGGHQEQHYHEDAHEHGNGNRARNQGNSHKKNQHWGSVVPTSYEGWYVEPLKALRKDETTWARTGTRKMLNSQRSLKNMVRIHKLQGGHSVRDLEKLTSNQRGSIARFLEERKCAERDKNAEWVLADVQPELKGSLWKKEITMLRVIFKRQDKDEHLRPVVSKTQPSKKNRRESPAYQPHEIIDLEYPMPRKPLKGRGKVRENQNQDRSDAHDERGGGHGGGHAGNSNNHQQPHNNNNNDNNNNHFQQHQQQPQPVHPGVMYSVQHHPMPPPIPIHQNGFQHGPLHHGNPFQPDPPYIIPDPYPPDLHDDFHRPLDGGRARPRSLRRRSSGRRRSSDVHRIEDKLDDLTDRMRHVRVGSDSSIESYGDDSLFSHAATGPDGHEFYSEPSSPRSGYSRGSLDRNRSGYRGEGRSRYRSERHALVPAYTHRDDHRLLPSPRRRGSRPRLHHASTYDDYPRRAPGLQRRLTDFDRYELDDKRWRRRSDVLYDDRGRVYHV